MAALSAPHHGGRGDETNRMGGAIATTCHSTKHVTREMHYLARQQTPNVAEMGPKIDDLP